MATGLFARLSGVASGQAAAPRGAGADERRLIELCALPVQGAPDARAKLIRLQTKVALEEFPFHDLSNLTVEPVTLVAGVGMKPVVLTQHAPLVEWLDAAIDVIPKLETEGVYQQGGWRLLRRTAVHYQGGKVVFDCLAIRMMPSVAAPSK